MALNWTIKKTSGAGKIFTFSFYLLFLLDFGDAFSYFCKIMMPIDFHGLGLSSLILKHSSESAMHSLSTTFYLEQEGNAAKHVDPAFIPMTKWAGRRPSRAKAFN